MITALNPRVTNVECLGNYTLRLEFSNGEIGLYDVASLLDFGVFSELKDIEYFKRVMIVNGTVAWPNEQDICPDTLYLESKKVRPTR